MSMRFLLRTLIALSSIVFTHHAWPEETIELRTAAQLSPPKYYTQPNGTIGGIGVDVLRAIEKVDPKIRFTGDQTYIPFARIQTLVASGELDFFVGIGLDEERQDKYAYLPQVVYYTRDGIFVLSNDPIKLNSLTDIKAIPGHRVITSQASAQLKEIASFGLNIDKSAQTAEASLRMLLGGRARFLYSNEVAIIPIARNLGVLDKIRMAYVNASEARYIIMSRHLSAAVQQQLRLAVDQLERSGELRRIADRHLK